MRFIFVLLFILQTFTVYAEEVEPTYNEHGKHDPFLPLVSPTGVLISYDSELSVTDMALEGVVADAKGNNLAIVNGKIVKMGDSVGPYTVESIVTDHVDLIKGQERLTLKLKKGGV